MAHLEIASPDVPASVAFYTERLGLRIVDEVDGTAYLRAWGDRQRYSLIVAPGDEPALRRMAWRTRSAAALEKAAASVEDNGIIGTWNDGGPGHGRSYDFLGPYGHGTRLVWEVEHYRAPAEWASSRPDRPERRSDKAGAPRSFDHVTVACRDPRGMADWYARALDFRITAYAELEHPPVTILALLTTHERSHDLGIVVDASDRAGRLHHVGFGIDTPEELAIAADLLTEHGIPIEFGPAIHDLGEQRFLYVREPSGLRVELSSGGSRNYLTDWPASGWTPSKGTTYFSGGGSMPPSMQESFPPAPGGSGTEDGVSADVAERLVAAANQGGRR